MCPPSFALDDKVVQDRDLCPACTCHVGVSVRVVAKWELMNGLMGVQRMPKPLVANLTEIDANAAILAAPTSVVPMREMLGSASLSVSSNGFGLFVLVIAIVLALVRCYLNGRERWLEMHQMQEMKEASTTLKRYTSRKMNSAATTSKAASAVHPDSSSVPDTTTKIVDF